MKAAGRRAAGPASKRPRSVVVTETREVYFHCSKVLRHSDLWNPDKRLPTGDSPTLGQIARDQRNWATPAREIVRDLAQDTKENLY